MFELVKAEAIIDIYLVEEVCTLTQLFLLQVTLGFFQFRIESLGLVDESGCYGF